MYTSGLFQKGIHIFNKKQMSYKLINHQGKDNINTGRHPIRVENNKMIKMLLLIKDRWKLELLFGWGLGNTQHCLPLTLYTEITPRFIYSRDLMECWGLNMVWSNPRQPSYPLCHLPNPVSVTFAYYFKVILKKLW